MVKFLEQLLPLITFYPRWAQVVFLATFALFLFSFLIFIVLYPSAINQKKASDSKSSQTVSPTLTAEQTQAAVNQLSKQEKDLFNRLNERDPQTPSDIDGSAAETYYRTANLFYATHRCSDALDLYDKTINLPPDWVKPHHLKGMTLEALGEWEKALEVYRLIDKLTAVEQPTAVASSLLNLTHTNFALGKFQETVLLCERVMSIVPVEHSPSYTWSAARLAANASRQLGDVKKETKHLLRFVGSSPQKSEELEAAIRRLEEIKGRE